VAIIITAYYIYERTLNHCTFISYSRCKRNGAIRGGVIAISVFDLMTLNMCYMLWDRPNFHQILIHLSYPSYPLLTCNVFTALHGMQTRSSDENSVRLSVRLFVRQTRELWQNERKISPDFYTINDYSIIYPCFLRKRMVGGGRPFLPSTGPRWSEITDFELIIARSASAVRPSENKFS